MARITRKPTDAALVLALACGATIENAARKAGVSERTAYRRLADPAFCRRVEETRADMVQRTGGMLTAGGTEAVKTLVALLDSSQPATVRMSSARTILEQGVKVREIVEFESRLKALEEQAANQKADRKD